MNKPTLPAMPETAGVKYCEAEQRNALMPTLFDFFNVTVEPGK